MLKKLFTSFVKTTLALVALVAQATSWAGYSAGALGCFDSFELAKLVACANWNPDTTSDPRFVYWRDSCVTTTIPNFTVYAHSVTVATGAIHYFTYSASLLSCPTSYDAGKSMGTPSGGTCTANPINAASGNKYQRETDISGHGLLSFARHYNSTKFEAPRDMGVSWQSAFSRTIVAIVLGSDAIATAYRPSGKYHRFLLNTGQWTTDVDVPDRLVEVTSAGVRTGWRYHDAAAKEMETYDATGKLLSIVGHAGRSVTLNYSDGSANPPNGAFVLDSQGNPTTTVLPAGVRIRVTDAFGRPLRFGYDATVPRRITRLEDAAAGVYRFSYDAAGHLSLATYPDGKTRSYLYNEPAQTGGASLPHALTGLIDELGVRFATWSYDATGRATSSEHAGGVERVSLAFATGQTTMTDVFGVQTTMGVASINGVFKNTGTSQPAGAGCAAANSYSTFDANGNTDSQDDFNGNRACRAFDLSRNLETTRIDGLANTAVCSTVTPPNLALPAGSSKTSSQWHPDWRLATKLAEPGRISAYIYNGQSDPFNGNTVASCAPAGALLPDGKPIAVLCKSVEQATTDANGALGFDAALQAGVANRVRQWSYNQNGQVLSETDSLGNASTYTYHASSTADYALGDLASASNPKAQNIQYTRYNAQGQLLRSLDSNGVTSDYLYDPRQRMLSRNVGGETTSYGYDIAGQLTRVTLPDASYLDYGYDAAQRLISINDNLGNRVDYQLDNAGNKLGEQLKDTGGALQAQINRVHDALNRIQQSTGE